MTKVQLNGGVSSSENQQNCLFDRPSFLPLHQKAEMIQKSSVLDQILYHLNNKSNKNRDKEHNINYKEKIVFIFLGFLVVLFLSSITGFFIMWFTDMYNDSLIANLVLAKNSTTAKWWAKPPIHLLLKVHIFNYTNFEEFLDGKAEKLKVEDLGPYVYKETGEKINIVYNNDTTITYKENRSFEFLNNSSNGSESDKIIVPNVPMLTTASMSKPTSIFDLIKASLVGGLWSATGAVPFKNLTVSQFLWGYKDTFLEAMDTLQSITLQKPIKEFGMLMNRNGISPESYTINTGEDDLKKLFLFEKFNGQSKLDKWSSEQCNSLGATDGSQFPPHWIDKEHVLKLFITVLCRKFPLVYQKEVSVFEGIPAWRYIAPKNIFANSKINPENKCYCNDEYEKCPPSGVHDVTKCTDNAPVMISYPHFYEGEEKLFEFIDGLKPNRDLHETYADIHPRLAFPIGGASRLQINIQVRRSPSMIRLKAMKDDMILPLIWIELMSGEIPEELRHLIYHTTFSANAIQLSLRYGSLLIFVSSFALLAMLCFCQTQSNKRYRESNNETIHEHRKNDNDVYDLSWMFKEEYIYCEKM